MWKFLSSLLLIAADIFSVFPSSLFYFFPRSPFSSIAVHPASSSSDNTSMMLHYDPNVTNPSPYIWSKENGRCKTSRFFFHNFTVLYCKCISRSVHPGLLNRSSLQFYKKSLRMRA
ncbi:hypothetical protein DFH94DRAFT_284857 [Russula ochroleuca]|uniref:Uncharacterized protein n=1 Tax=Russula ochroleuca TaxID=152965 RepID=A0A9P5JXQ4_9AGAM|nr:hypothetical protein DFH94DRAFT_284857 [Russula ochroleuca]